MVLKGVIFSHFHLRGCGGHEIKLISDKFLVWEEVVVF